VYVGQQKKDSYLKEKGRNLEIKIIYLSIDKKKYGYYIRSIFAGYLSRSIWTLRFRL
jgi:hypothetical protein